MDFTDQRFGLRRCRYSDGIHLIQMVQIFWAATSGTRSRLSHSLALLVNGALARLLQRCSGRSAFFRIATDPSFRLGTQPTLTQDLPNQR